MNSAINSQDYNSPDWNAAWKNFLEMKAIKYKLTPSQTRVFLTRFKRDNWLSRIEDVWQQSDVNSFEAFVSHSTKVYRAFNNYCPELSKGAGNFPVLRDCLLDEFSQGSLTEKSLDDYGDTRYQLVLQPGALIRIKAPSKMGKTRLLNNILSFANQQNYQIVHINFLQIESSKFESLDLFLRWFCISISDALNLEIDLKQYWDQDRGSKQSCTRFLEDLLHTFQQPFVLGLDEVDRLLNYPDISQDFFYLLRYWHEEANNEELWEQLRLIVVYSTEDFGSLDINQSPFNVGIPIELKPFEPHKIEELAQVYQLDLSNSDIDQLINMLGGHPYLVDVMMSHLIKEPQISLEIVLEQATTDIGIYGSFLRQHLINLRANSELAHVFLEIINSQIPIQIDTLLAYQLYRMGLIQWSNSGKTVIPSCELYRLYFQERLAPQEITNN
ncbi:MAG: AAA-like domain-containing protein [Cyanobacteria bacterium P01_G01_bin.67]